ncbi:MAG TPA: gephyrin-like molybdotransferase receptor GlpR [Mycobacterium sp.]
MPSIPQSLLWISLVVLWLFVLVPMLISKRDTVRRTSDVALATRVLNTGGGRLLRRRSGPAAGHHSDPDWRPSEDHLDDADDDHDEDDHRDAPSRRPVVQAAAAVSTEPDYLDVDVVEMDSGALPVGASAARPVVQAAAAVSTEPDYLDVDIVEMDSGALPVGATAARQAEAEADGHPELPLDYDDNTQTFSVEDLSEVDAAEPEAEPEDSTDVFESLDDGTEHDYEYVDDSSGLEAPSDTDLHVADSISEARRKRYESKTAAAVSARKYKFRKRMLLAMGVVMVVTAAVAFLVSPTFWWACGTVAAVTLLYLGYLRRQTRIEEQVRRRRAQRMARSRLGVESTQDPEFDVVPSRLRRPGAVVLEIDDEDPIFEHLDYAPFAAEYDLPRAAGE